MPQPKPKILYLITKANFGGAQRYVLELASDLNGDSCEVVVASNGKGGLIERLQTAHIAHTTIAHFQRDINPLKEILALIEVVQLLRRQRPDVLHTNSSKAGVMGALAGRLVGTRRIVFTAHGWPFLEERNWLWRTMAWLGSYLTALLSHQVILVSENDLRHAHMPGVRHKCTVIHNGVVAQHYLDRAAARRALFDTATQDDHVADAWLVTTAELHPNKNQRAVIEAVFNHNAASAQKLFYVLMGDGDQRAELEAYVAAHQGQDQIAFLGYVDDPMQYLHAFDVFILPSKKEGLPYSLLDAGVAGLTCIASNRGGIPEIITDQHTGRLINPDDAHHIAKALAETIAEQNESRAQARNLQEKIQREFSLSTMCKMTRTLYGID